MQNKLRLREAANDERPTIAEITRLSYLEYARESDADSWKAYESRSREAVLASEDNQSLVIELENKLIASVLLCPPYESTLGDRVVKNPYPEIRLLAVLPQHRNLGAAGLLIEECEKRIKSAGFKASTLHTTDLMKAARAMYERRGYIRYTEIDFKSPTGLAVDGYWKKFPE